MDDVLVSIVAADALVLKHQAISIHNTDPILTAQDQFHKIITSNLNIYDLKFILKKNEPVV